MNLRVAHIIAACADAFEVTPRDITAQRAFPKYARARFAVVHLARTMTNRSYPQIGKALGNRDHTTIIYAAQRAEQLLASDPEWAATVEGCRRALVILERAGLCEPFDGTDVVTVARRIDDNPARHACMATDREIAAMAAWIVDRSRDDMPNEIQEITEEEPLHG